MQFSLVQTYFSLVLVICLSWYLHLKLSHDLLTLISFNIWRYKFTSGAIYLTLWRQNGLSKRLKDQSIWTGSKYKWKVSSYMDSTKMLLRGRLNLGFNLSYFSCYCKFWAFRVIHVYIPFFFCFFVFFYLRISIPTIPKTSLTFRVSKQGVTSFLTQLASILIPKS